MAQVGGVGGVAWVMFDALGDLGRLMGIIGDAVFNEEDGMSRRDD